MRGHILQDASLQRPLELPDLQRQKTELGARGWEQFRSRKRVLEVGMAAHSMSERHTSDRSTQTQTAPVLHSPRLK